MTPTPFSEELERILAHAWCHHVRRDYRLNRLWGGERALQVSLGMGLRQWLDPYPEIRVWFEATHPYRKQGKDSTKIVDLIIVRLSPEHAKQGDHVYDEMADIQYDDLLICELKYSSSKTRSIDTDLAFLEQSQVQTSDVVQVFGWIPYTDEKTRAQEKIDLIVAKTAAFPLRFMLGRPTSPFRWSYYGNGEEMYFSQD
ncbi:MAG: hypothetical protein ACFFFG_11940 [Candidatus Thorarchaeota archaeon]